MAGLRRPLFAGADKREGKQKSSTQLHLAESHSHQAVRSALFEIHGTRHICLKPARHNGEIIPDVPLIPFLFECSLQMADPKMLAVKMCEHKGSTMDTPGVTVALKYSAFHWKLPSYP